MTTFEFPVSNQASMLRTAAAAAVLAASTVAFSTPALSGLRMSAGGAQDPPHSLHSQRSDPKSILGRLRPRGLVRTCIVIVRVALSSACFLPFPAASCCMAALSVSKGVRPQPVLNHRPFRY